MITDNNISVTEIETRHDCHPEHAHKFADWIANRGGVAVWKSLDLSDPTRSWSTPANTIEGTPITKPTWQASNAPDRIITSADDIDVFESKVVKTLRIAVRVGSQGFTLKLTDASTSKVNEALKKAGSGSFYRFGGWDGKDCEIHAITGTITLAEWLQKKNENNACTAS